MKDIQIFRYEDNDVRTMEINGEPWFVGKDVAAVLEYSNPRKALADHVDQEDKGVTKCDTLGGVQELTMGLDYRAKTETFELYKGVDRTEGLDAVLFVQERGTAPGLVVDKDISEYKNVCYCEAQYKDGTKFVVQAGTASDAERRELWASFSGDSQQDEESNADFERRVKQYAALQLGSHLNRNGFSIDADGDELGTAYNVGDLVWCVSLRLGVKYKARIAAAKYSQDANGSSVKLVIGDPILTVLR